MGLSKQLLILGWGLWGCSSVLAAQEETGAGINFIKEDIKDEVFTLTVDDPHVKTVVNVPFNFTVSIENAPWKDDELEVFWESTGYRIIPRDELGQKLIFTRTGPATQMVQLESDLIGIFYLRFYTLDSHGENVYISEEPEVELLVRRENLNQSKIFTLLITGLLGIALVFMGLDLDIQIVIQTIKKPIGPLIGMASQFVLMPTFAYFLGWAFLQTNFERLGLLILGCSPGGANSNFWTAMFHGDINLSCTMTFLSTVSSFAFTSLWVYFLGTPLVGKTIPIPYLQIAMSLASFTIPLILGVAVKYKWPKKAESAKKISRPFFLCVLVILPSYASWTNVHFFYLCSWRHLFSGACLGFMGYIFGAALAALLQQGKAQIIAISLETAIQNGGISLIVLNMTFPSPYSDMGIMPVMSFFFCSTGPIMFVIYAVYSLVRKIKGFTEFKPVATEDKEGQKL